MHGLRSASEVPKVRLAVDGHSAAHRVSVLVNLASRLTS